MFLVLDQIMGLRINYFRREDCALSSEMGNDLRLSAHFVNIDDLKRIYVPFSDTNEESCDPDEESHNNDNEESCNESIVKDYYLDDKKLLCVDLTVQYAAELTVLHTRFTQMACNLTEDWKIAYMYGKQYDIKRVSTL